ncbi:MAG: hypothetical protein DDT40_01716 [candidate division WS2 bacterium]|nr:hypothetical protein [Candidatus Psychracetigena formicireducens]
MIKDKNIKEKIILGYTIPDHMILDRSYYTTEEEAKLKIYLTKDTLEKIKGKLLLQIEVKDKEGNQVLKEKEHRLPHNTLFSSFKIKDFPVGDYSVSAKLESEDQEVVVFSQTLKKLPPHHNEVKVNRFTRMLLVNDEPFIPLISSAQFWGKRLAGHGVPDNSLEIVAKESGFNTLAIWPFTCKTQIEECHRQGLKVILFPLVTWQKTGKELTEALKGVFKEYKDSPNLLAWIIADEGNIGGTEEEFKERYKILKEIDPYRPIFRNDIWTVGHGGPGGLETTDIFCGGYGDWRLVDAINIDAVPRGVPSLTLADWMDYGVLRPIGYPTPSETISWIYQVLIHGACGGFWWGTHHARPFVPALWEAMRQIRKEMDFLAPVFNTLDPGIKITCDNPAIHFTVRKYQGKYYLICVNVKSTREKAEFKLDPAVFSKKGEAIVLFEGKKKEWKNGKIIDFFNPLERRVYQIRGE